ncbi:MAG: cyclomaltodextrinase N-terminal domain-containing protein [Paludibacteraceae bacterium]|nr:cyclomaltodextrinase N-terminal domain-containing protein [Paludibacteraceae bacterium]
MKKYYSIALLFCAMLLTPSLSNAQKIERVEPLSWWTDMKMPLRLMFHGKELQSAEVSIKEPGLTITKVSKAESPNYLFVDVEVEKAGIYTFTLKVGKKKLTYKYTIAERCPNSPQRQSFTAADVMYLLMPDRFANGDATNDEVAGMAEGADKNAFYGRHGGDIQGIINHLDYIKDLGATTIWSTPLLADNESFASYHGYACADYYHIDPRYGSNELYKEMVNQAHQKGLKVIMDIVTNHCGMAHWWMKDLPFQDWVHQFSEFTRSNNVFSANMDPNASKHDKMLHESGWFDLSMPDMNLDNPELLRYFQQWAIWWIEYAGLDGLRVDTYPYNEKEPMSKWCAAVRAEYPNINIVGECWTRPSSQVAYWQDGANNADKFNSNLPSVMDFPLQEAICQGLNEDGRGWNEGMARIYTTLSNDYLYADVNKLLIFSGNHDMERIADILHKDVQKVKMAITMIATMRGIPQIFYGEEQMLVSKDMRQGHGGLRIDFPGGWQGDTTNLFLGTGSTPEQTEIFNYYKSLLNWRKAEPVLHNGKTLHFLMRDNTYAYFRYNTEKAILVYINASDIEKEIPWTDYAEILTQYHPVGKEVFENNQIDSQTTHKVPAKGIRIIEFVIPK